MVGQDTLAGIRTVAQRIVMGTYPDLRPPEVRTNPHEPPVMCRYYWLLYEFARLTNPRVCVETGTFRGASALHLAAGCPGTSVLTIDSDPGAKVLVDALGRKNILAVSCDSVKAVEMVKEKYSPIDILFLDSEHSYEVAAAEWELYRPFLKPGGVAFMDDIHMNPGMDRFWSEIKDPKVELNDLHVKGFGAVSPA